VGDECPSSGEVLPAPVLPVTERDASTSDSRQLLHEVQLDVTVALQGLEGSTGALDLGTSHRTGGEYLSAHFGDGQPATGPACRLIGEDRENGVLDASGASTHDTHSIRYLD